MEGKVGGKSEGRFIFILNDLGCATIYCILCVVCVPEFYIYS
jgi:hypothetical protein